MIRIWEASLLTPGRVDQRHFIEYDDAIKETCQWIGDMRDVHAVHIDDTDAGFMKVVKVYGFANCGDSIEDALYTAYIRGVTLYEKSDFGWNPEYGTRMSYLSKPEA